jgi:hypothetical protein
LSITDLAGTEVLTTEHCGSVSVVPLPAGTYHVAMRAGAVLRRYTLTLEPGTVFELHVNLSPVRALSIAD